MTQQTYWLAACTAAPMTGAGTNLALAECQQTNTQGYARFGIATNAWTVVSGSGSAAIRNTTTISFPTAVGAWGTIGWMAVCNTATPRTGEVLGWAAVTNTVVTTGDTLRFITTAFSFTLL